MIGDQLFGVRSDCEFCHFPPLVPGATGANNPNVESVGHRLTCSGCRPKKTAVRVMKSNIRVATSGRRVRVGPDYRSAIDPEQPGIRRGLHSRIFAASAFASAIISGGVPLATRSLAH